MKKIIEIGVHHDHITEQHVHSGVCSEKGFDALQTPRQVLFVAVEVSQDVALVRGEARDSWRHTFRYPVR